MNEQDIEKYINTPVGLALRELVDPLVESGEVVLANGDTAESNDQLLEYLGTSVPSVPYQVDGEMGVAGCGCLLGTAVEALAQAGSGVRPRSVCGIDSAVSVLAQALGVDRDTMRSVEAGFENRPHRFGILVEAYNTGRALALHYGLL
jgi:hypothetical protein